MHVYVSVFMFAFVCVCLCVRRSLCRGKARIGGPAGTTLVNNGSFILPEHLTGLCVATATHTQTHSLKGNTHTEGFTHSFAKSLGVFTGGQFSLTLDTCVYVRLCFSFLCVLVCVCC